MTMSTHSDLVSIITPVYNCEHYIEDTINSILAQTYSNWELILIDDCSTDASVAIIKEKYLQDARIRLISNKANSGAAVSRNNGIQASKGRFICFLDSDDLWKPSKLENQLAFQLSHNYAFTYTTYLRQKEGRIVGEIKAKPAVNHTDLLKTCSIGCSSVMLDMQQFDRIQFPNIRKRQDYALWLNLLKKVDYAYGLDKPLTVYLVRNDSISSNKFKAATFQWHVYKKVEKLSWIKSVYYLLHYTFHGIKNRL